MPLNEEFAGNLLRRFVGRSEWTDLLTALENSDSYVDLIREFGSTEELRRMITDCIPAGPSTSAGAPDAPRSSRSTTPPVPGSGRGGLDQLTRSSRFTSEGCGGVSLKEAARDMSITSDNNSSNPKPKRRRIITDGEPHHQTIQLFGKPIKSYLQIDEAGTYQFICEDDSQHDSESDDDTADDLPSLKHTDSSHTDSSDTDSSNLESDNIFTSNSFSNPTSALTDILSNICENIPSSTFHLTIDRKQKILPQIFTAIKSIRFSLTATLILRFTNEAGVGKGLIVDMFTAAFQEMNRSLFLEGEEYDKTFVKLQPAIEDGTFELLGVLVAWAIINRVFPGFFSRSARRMILYGHTMARTSPLEPSDLPQLERRSKLRDVVKARTYHTARSAILSTGIFSEAGQYPVLPQKNWKEGKEKAVQGVLQYFCCDRIKEEFEAFTKGMNRGCGLLSALRALPSEAEDLFKKSEQSVLTRRIFLDQFYVNSDVRMSTVFKFFIRYLGKVEKKKLNYRLANGDDPEYTLNHILSWSTGYATVPLLGYHNPPNIVLADVESVKPQSCICELQLPRGVTDYDQFELAMNIALEDLAFTTN